QEASDRGPGAEAVGALLGDAARRHGLARRPAPRGSGELVGPGERIEAEPSAELALTPRCPTRRDQSRQLAALSIRGRGDSSGGWPNEGAARRIRMTGAAGCTRPKPE